MISNCPIAPSDINITQAIMGLDLGSEQWKTNYCTPTLVAVDYVAVPQLLVERNKVTMATVIFFGWDSILGDIVEEYQDCDGGSAASKNGSKP